MGTTLWTKMACLCLEMERLSQERQKDVADRDEARIDGRWYRDGSKRLRSAQVSIGFTALKR